MPGGDETKSAAVILENLFGGYASEAGRTGKPVRKCRRIISSLLKEIGGRAGAVYIWDQDRKLVLNAVRGLAPQYGRALQKASQYPPEELKGILNRIECTFLKKDQEPEIKWQSLEKVIIKLANIGELGLWQLKMAGWYGIIIILFKGKHNLSRELAKAISGGLSLVLENILIQAKEESAGEDYKRIFTNSRDMIYLSSRDGRWIDVNQAAVDMLGYANKQQLLAVKDISKEAYLNPRDREDFIQAIEKMGFVKDYEVTFRKKDGTPVEVSITAQVRRRQGSILGYEGIIKDITIRKMAERQMDEARKRIASILEVAPVAIFVVDKGHKVTQWNAACEELTGVSRGKILGKKKAGRILNPNGESQTLADYLVDENIDALKRDYDNLRLRRSTVSEDAWEMEDHYENLGGKPKEVFLTASALRGPRGEVVAAVQAILDLTEIYELELQLAESEKLYRTLVEANREGIALHRHGSGFIFINEAFRKMFGFNMEGEVEGHFLEVVAPAYRREYLKWIKNPQNGKAAEDVFEGQGLRGEEAFDMEVNAVEVMHKGEPGLLFNVRDVSARKRMEDQLIRSERLAATGKLAFDIAHEINNPLGGILTYSHLMQEDLEEDAEDIDQVKRNLAKIIKLTNRCKIIVRGLLDFARQEGPEKEAFEINGVLMEMLELVKGHLIMKGIQMNVDIEAQLPKFYGRRGKIEQVLLNMIINAAEAMDGKGQLNIKTWSRHGGREIAIDIEDNGPGIEEDVKNKIFDPFFTTKDRGRGTGLGLSISHGIIKQHKGQIKVQSTPGKGARFTIILPSHSGLT